MKIRLASPLQQDSIVDGKGLRTVIWMQGCIHNCLGCHNPETHDLSGGYEEDVEEIKERLLHLKYQDGITLSGGDPFVQIEPCLEIAMYAKSLGLSVWCYTGYTFEKLLELSKKDKKIIKFLKTIDILIDGPFILKEKSFDTIFRGSKNQRILDVSKSIKAKKAVIAKEYIGN